MSDSFRFTPSALRDNHGMIEEMTRGDITFFLQANYNKRLPKHIRPLINRRLRDLNHEDSVEIRSESINERVDAIWSRIGTLWKLDNTRSLKKYHARSMGTDIHDFPSIWSGLESEKSLILREEAKNKGNKYHGCREHYYPRQWAGAEIIERIICEGPNFTKLDLATMICKFSQVHIVTQKENQILLPYQTTIGFEGPQEAYESAGILLVRTAPLQIHGGWQKLIQKLENEH